MKTAQVTIEDVDRLIDAPASVFQTDLAGYAAAGVAVYLQEHWGISDPKLTRTDKLSDVEEVIKILRQWQRVID